MTKPAKAVKSTEQVEERTAKQLPIPKGYKILIALPEPEEQTKGGIIKASQTMQVEEVGSICGFILAMGDDCYKGTRFKVHGKEFRLINDDSVEAVVEDPRGIVKVI